jgi:hypothetical protein
VARGLAEDFVLSASSVSTFLRCGRQWYFAYVAGVRSRPTLKAGRGIAIHKAVEVDMIQKITSREDVPLDVMMDAYDTSWDEEGKDGWRPDPDLKPGEVKDKGYELVKLYRDTVAPTIQPTLVEEPISFRINGQVYTGQIDLGEEKPEPWTGDPQLIIRDTKSTGRKPEPHQYLLNMTGYAVGMRQRGGRIEADTVLDFLVATKEPYYLPIHAGGPITDDQVNQFAGIIGDVASTIQAGKFVPNGLVNGTCEKMCGYKDICPAYLKNNRNA